MDTKNNTNSASTTQHNDTESEAQLPINPNGSVDVYRTETTEGSGGYLRGSAKDKGTNDSQKVIESSVIEGGDVEDEDGKYSSADNDKVEEDYEEDTRNLPIDRGWAWVILFANVFQVFISAGLNKSFGIFFINYMQRFDASAASVSLIFTVQNIFISFTAILILNIVMKTLGARLTSFLGTLMLSVGYIITAYATRIEILHFSLGILVGTAVPMHYFPFVASLPLYFKKHRGFANSAAASGSSLGGLVFAPIIVHLFEEYGYSGAFLLISGITLHVLMAALLLRPIESYQRKKRLRHSDKHEKMTPIKTESLAKDQRYRQNGVYRSLPVLNDQNQTNKTRTGDFIADAEEIKPFLPLYKSHSVSILRKRTTSESSASGAPYFKETLDYIAKSKVALYASSDVVNASLVDTEPSNSRPKLSGDSSNSLDSRCSVLSCLKSTGNFLGSVLDFSLMKNPVFLVYLVMAFFILPGVMLVQVYLAPYAKQIGISTKKIGVMYTVIGSIDLLAKLAAGFIVDRKWARHTTVLATSSITIGIASQFVRFLTTFETLMIMVVINGLCGAIYIAMYAVILADYMGLDKFKSSLGLAAMVHGVAIATVFPLAGVLYDVTETYVTPFHMLGLLAIVGGVLCLSLPYVHKWYERKNIKKEEMC